MVWVVQQRLSPHREVKNLIVVLVVPVWSWRPRGFLESYWSSFYIGNLKKKECLSSGTEKEKLVS